MPEFKIHNPLHIKQRFPEMEQRYPKFYNLLEWRTAYSFDKPNDIQQEFLDFVHDINGIVEHDR